MEKKIVVLTLCVLLLLFAPITRASVGNPPPRPMEAIWEGAGIIRTLDPVWCYDTYTASLIFNVMEPVIFFMGERYDRFEGILATEAYIGPPPPDAPEYTNHTYYFKIRTGLPFHTCCRADIGPLTWPQYYLTPYDCEYSYERWSIISPPGYAHQMLYEAVFGGLYEPELTADFGRKIDAAFQSNATHFWINIANEGFAPGTPTPFTPILILPYGPDSPGLEEAPINYCPGVFMQVIAQSWASILSHQWIVNFVNPKAEAMGRLPEWNGTWIYEGPGNWTIYHSPAKSNLDLVEGGVMCGTGPFWLEIYDPMTGYTLKRFEAYWRGWPAPGPSPPYPPRPSSGIRPQGYLEIFKYVRETDPAKRIADLIAGFCDFAAIPKEQAGELHVGGDRYGPTLPGIRLIFPIPTLTTRSFHYTFNISLTSTYMTGDETVPDPDGDGVYGLPVGTIREDGIPPDFFANPHVRKGFSYSINYTMLIEDIMQGEAYQPTTCSPAGLKYYNPAQEKYTLDTDKAEDEFKKAIFTELDTGLNKSVWEVGFSVIITFNVGNTFREALCEDISARLAEMNPKFHVVVKSVDWNTYRGKMWAHELPAFSIGWLADYVDIHNFMHPYLHTSGAFAWAQRYSNPDADALLEEGIRLTDGPERETKYKWLQEIYFEDCPSVTVCVPIGRHYERKWMNGWFCNPIHPGIYAYSLWKWNYLPGDYDRNGKVDMADIGYACKAFGSYYGFCLKAMHGLWNFWCDADGRPRDGWRDNKIDMYDIGVACDYFGKSVPPWTPP